MCHETIVSMVTNCFFIFFAAKAKGRAMPSTIRHCLNNNLTFSSIALKKIVLQLNTNYPKFLSRFDFTVNKNKKQKLLVNRNNWAKLSDF